MNDKALYSAKRWTDIPKPQRGKIEQFTEEQKKQNRKDLETIMKEYGIIKQDETL